MGTCVYGYVCARVRASLRTHLHVGVQGQGTSCGWSLRGAACTEGHRGQRSTQRLGDPEPTTLLPPPQAPPQGLPGPNSSGVILVMFSPKPSAVLFYLFIYFALISSPLHCLMSPGKNYFPPPKKKERKKSIMEKKVNSRCQERTKEHPWLCAKPRAGNVPFPPGNGLIPPQIF